MFQRQAFVGGKWVPEGELEWRHVDLCDGCGQMIKEPTEPFHFRVALFNEADMANALGRTTHPAPGCVKEATLKFATEFLRSLEGWPG